MAIYFYGRTLWFSRNIYSPWNIFFSLTSLPIITLINAMNPGWNEAMHFCVNVWRLWLQNWLQESPKKLRLHHQPLGTYSIKYDTDIQSHLIYLSNCCIYTNIPNIFENQWKTRSARTPTFWEYPPPPHDYPYHWFISDRPTDKVKPVYPLPLNFVAGGIKIMVCQDINLSIDGSMDQRPRKI